MVPPLVLAFLVLAAPPGTKPAAEAESAAARAQARKCEARDLGFEEAISACREALRLGLREPRRSAVRQLLAQHLASAQRFDELVALYQEDTVRRTEDPEAWRHLGAAQLFLKEDPVAALPALEAAVRLRADDAPLHVLLGICLNALGRYQESGAAFEEAVRLDPEALSLRPAAEAVRQASSRGERWP